MMEYLLGIEKFRKQKQTGKFWNIIANTTEYPFGKGNINHPAQ